MYNCTVLKGFGLCVCVCAHFGLLVFFFFFFFLLFLVLFLSRQGFSVALQTVLELALVDQAGLQLTVFVCLLVYSLFVFVFGERVSLCSLGCPGTHSVIQADLKLTEIHLYLIIFLLVVWFERGGEKERGRGWFYLYHHSCPGNSYIHKAGMQLRERDQPACASQVLGLKAYTHQPPASLERYHILSIKCCWQAPCPIHPEIMSIQRDHTSSLGPGISELEGRLVCRANSSNYIDCIRFVRPGSL